LTSVCHLGRTGSYNIVTTLDLLLHLAVWLLLCTDTAELGADMLRSLLPVTLGPS
jgi:hypothetical protein